jgi:DNA-binding CsgD family transcriptional regulator
MTSAICVSEAETPFYRNNIYQLSYCIEPIEYVSDRFKEGFIPSGPIFFDSARKIFCQSLIKHTCLSKKTKNSVLPSMTSREIKCLKLLLREYSIKEMATYLKCSPSSIEKNLKHLRKKFNVKKNIGLACLATQCGFDDLQV